MKMKLTLDGLILDCLYVVDGYVTFNVKVTSGEFSGASNFCLAKEKVKLAIEELSKMYDTLQGSYVIRDNDSDAHMIFEIQKLGHLHVQGQIGGSHEEHLVKFKYVADQTILVELINVFRNFYNKIQNYR